MCRTCDTFGDPPVLRLILDGSIVRLRRVLELADVTGDAERLRAIGDVIGHYEYPCCIGAVPMVPDEVNAKNSGVRAVARAAG